MGQRQTKLKELLKSNGMTQKQISEKSDIGEY